MQYSGSSPIKNLVFDLRQLGLALLFGGLIAGGQPSAHAAAATPASPAAHPFAAPQFYPGLSLLDEIGRLNHPLPRSTLRSWQTQLHSASLPPARRAQLLLWLGEYRLGREQDPEGASALFGRVQRLVGQRTPLCGRAAYDRAFCLFYEGAYQNAISAFHALLPGEHPLRGYDPRECILIYRHAQACFGYHLKHAELGIPEPSRLDPLCAVSALSVCLRARGLPWNKARVIAALRPTGEGNNLQEVIYAGPKLQVKVRSVTADDTGLMHLPKPCVAFVESDHFIAVTRADTRGVSYVCSDCGPWPGGQVNLSWRQWRVLRAGVYAVVTRPGSSSDRMVSAILSPHRPTAHLASIGSLRGLIPGLTAVQALKLHIVAALPPSGGSTCGSSYTALHCPCYIGSPKVGGGPGGGGSAAGGG